MQEIAARRRARMIGGRRSLLSKERESAEMGIRKRWEGSMPRGFAGETVSQEAWGGSRASVARGRTSAYGSRSRGMGSAARSTQDRGSAVRELAERESRSQAAMSGIPLPGLVAALNIGSAMRAEITRQIQAGGTPVRENGMVIGVMTNGRYTGRQREADRLAMQQANRDGGQPRWHNAWHNAWHTASSPASG